MTHPNPTHTRTRPTTLASLVLAAAAGFVLASAGTTTDGQVTGRLDRRQAQPDVLPSAAEQRREQIRLTAEILDRLDTLNTRSLASLQNLEKQLEETNRRLDRLAERLGEADAARRRENRQPPTP